MRPPIIALMLFVLTALQAGLAVAPALPKVEIADVQAPVSSVIVVERGSNLRSIAATAYGSEEFSAFVGQLNGITVPERLRAGVTLKTLPLPIAFRDAGLDPHYQPAVNALAKAWQDAQTILLDYTKARNASGMRNGQSFQISPHLRSKLVECSDGLDAAIEVLKHPLNGQSTPRSAVGQFAKASDSLRQLSTGSIGSRDYDTFMIEKEIGLGFFYALVWAQAGEQ